MEKQEELIGNQEPDQKRKARRTFFKKVAYKTPVLIALGYLARPQGNAIAASSNDTNEGPGGNPGGGL